MTAITSWSALLSAYDLTNEQAAGILADPAFTHLVEGYKLRQAALSMNGRVGAYIASQVFDICKPPLKDEQGAYISVECPRCAMKLRGRQAKQRPGKGSAAAQPAQPGLPFAEPNATPGTVG